MSPTVRPTGSPGSNDSSPRRRRRNASAILLILVHTPGHAPWPDQGGVFFSVVQRTVPAPAVAVDLVELPPAHTDVRSQPLTRSSASHWHPTGRDVERGCASPPNSPPHAPSRTPTANHEARGWVVERRHEATFFSEPNATASGDPVGHAQGSGSWFRIRLSGVSAAATSGRECRPARRRR